MIALFDRADFLSSRPDETLAFSPRKAAGLGSSLPSSGKAVLLGKSSDQGHMLSEMVPSVTPKIHTQPLASGLAQCIHSLSGCLLMLHVVIMPDMGLCW